LQALVDESVSRCLFDGFIITMMSQWHGHPVVGLRHLVPTVHSSGFGSYALCCNQQQPTLLAVQDELKEWLTSRCHRLTQSALLL
jgi:hypothetical protein